MLNNKQTNNRQESEWYNCDRCGFQYPRSNILNQNGLTLCTGEGTNNCADKPGHAANLRMLDIPYEEVPDSLPIEDIDL